MAPPLISNTLELVVIQNRDGNPETIEAGESIAVVSRNGHLPAEQVAPALAALGIQKIPVGTRIRELNEYVEKIQQVFRRNTDGIHLIVGLDIAQSHAKAAGIEVNPKDLAIVRKNFAEVSQATLARGIKHLANGDLWAAHNSIELALYYAQKGEFSSEKLDLALNCVKELKSAKAANRQGDLQARNRHLERARLIAKELSISLEKTEESMFFGDGNFGLLMYLQQNPKFNPTPPESASKLPLIDLHWEYKW